MAIKTLTNPSRSTHKRLKTRFGRIGVLMGGPSSEREISFKSGKAVYESLQKLAIDAVAIDIPTDDPEAAKALIKSHGIECAFIALHGHFGEDGKIQAILDELGIRYTGSGVGASSRAMDKVRAKKIFQEHGLPQARCIAVDKKTYRADGLHPDFGLPWVIKPATGGSSIGLSIVDRQEDVPGAVATAFDFDGHILIEEYIQGRELTVAIVHNKPLCVIEIVTTKKFFDFQAKYQHGFTEYKVPAPLNGKISRAVQKTALTAHTLLGCRGFSRVDIILRADGAAYVLEVNTIPGLTATSLLPKAALFEGIDFDHLCLSLLESAYEKE